ncbi:MAG: MXAN_6577-like cysteine-rich protein [Polyangiaceae bacterium]
MFFRSSWLGLICGAFLAIACGSSESTGPGAGSGGRSGTGAGGTTSTTTGGSTGCPGTQASCSGSCVDLSSSATNCGSCGKVCASGQTCSGSSCQCLTGLSLCGSSCVDTKSNASNCGSCGTTCASGQVCSNGTCGTSCSGGTTQCGSSCVDLTSNASNCGACGTACPAGQTCSGSTCSCPSGQTKCGSSCVDTKSNASNCGSCGTTCQAGATCNNGSCTGGSGGSGSGGNTSAGGSSSGGASNGGATSGGSTNGGSSSGGAATGGRASGGTTSTSGGTSAGGTASGGSGTGGSGSGGVPGTCDPGSTTTAWATDCPTAPPTTCTAGTWVAGGPQNDSCCSAMTLRSESAHFAVYADESSVTSSTAQAAVNHLETVWNLYFGSPMYMKEPFCNSATKYKANVHVHSSWGLTGGSFNNRMGMWIGTGGLNDPWGLAHEFMHGVQSVSGGQACNSSNTCGWIYESHANWAAQQQGVVSIGQPANQNVHTSNVHCSEMLANMPHLYLGSTRDRYCNWQFMEYLKDRYCFKAVNAMWNGTPSADPLTGIRNGMGWSVAQLNDFMGEWAMHNITWDYQDPAPQATAGKNQGALFRQNYGITTNTSKPERRLRTTKVEPLDTDFANNRRFISPFYWAPQRYGYNVVRLFPEASATSVTVTFRGVTSAVSSPDWRWGLVATDSGITTARYSALQKGSDASLTFCVKSGESLFLVVTATPSAWYNIVWDQPYNTVPRYPYMFSLAGAWPEGFQNGAKDACPSNLTRASNGGGCAPSGTSAYVGPYATVLGGTVGSSARIEDHAIVASGTVSGGTVTAMSIISGFNMSSGTAKTTFYPLGFFETGQGLSGATLVGDVEYRGGGYNRSSGTCSGFVDSATCVAPGTDATPVAPYTWR